MGSYDNIIHLPHHTSTKHPRMSMYQRAAQFAPFAALTGHGAAIIETARLTERPIELSDYERSVLDRKLAFLLLHIDEEPSVTVTYFVPDQHKEGGSYTVHTGTVAKWDEHQQLIIFSDKTAIHLPTIINLEAPFFPEILR